MNSLEPSVNNIGKVIKCIVHSSAISTSLGSNGVLKVCNSRSILTAAILLSHLHSVKLLNKAHLSAVISDFSTIEAVIHSVRDPISSVVHGLRNTVKAITLTLSKRTKSTIDTVDATNDSLLIETSLNGRIHVIDYVRHTSSCVIVPSAISSSKHDHEEKQNEKSTDIVASEKAIAKHATVIANYCCDISCTKSITIVRKCH